MRSTTLVPKPSPLTPIVQISLGTRLMIFEGKGVVRSGYAAATRIRV